MTYVCAEPEQIEAFLDNESGLHLTRDAAIDASFANDFSNAVYDMTCGPSLQNEMENGTATEFAEAAIRQFAVDHEDLLRVILGDREAT